MVTSGIGHAPFKRLALAVGVRELIGHGGSGEGNNQGDGEKELLHDGSPLTLAGLISDFDRLAMAPVDTR